MNTGFVIRYIVVVLFCFFGGCVGQHEKEEKQSITSISVRDNIYTVSIYNTTVVFCSGTDSERDPKRIYYINQDNSRTELFYTVENNNKCVMPARLYDKQMVWIEYSQTEENIFWELCTKGISGKTNKQIIKNNQNNPMAEVPHFDISGKMVVFDYFIASGSDTIDSHLYLYNIKTKAIAKIKAPKGYDLFAPKFNGTDNNEIVCCILSLDKNQHICSRIAVYNIRYQKWNILSITNTGFQPSIYNKKLVFKECATPFQYGTIQLYDMETGQMQKLSSDTLGGELPQVNNNYVVWESPYFDKIPAYNLITKKPVVLEKGTTGKPFLQGNSLVWVAEEKSGQPVIHAMTFN